MVLLAHDDREILLIGKFAMSDTSHQSNSVQVQV
jgi:hypothetical protein